MNVLQKLSKQELINIIAKSNISICCKCGELKEVNISVTRGIKLRKLCSLCEDCYIELLDFLGTRDSSRD